MEGTVALDDVVMEEPLEVTVIGQLAAALGVGSGF